MNKEIEIYIRNNTFEFNIIAQTRGYRFDVFVKYKNNFFELYVLSFKNFYRDLKLRYNRWGFYYSKSNLLIVKKVTKENIIRAVLKNVELNYFDRIKECEVIGDEIKYLLSNYTVKIDKLIEIYS